MTKLRFSLFVLTLLIFSNIVLGKKIDSTKFKIKIEQIIQPGPNPIYSYKIKPRRISVYKEPLFFNRNIGIKIRKQSIKLNETDCKTILSILKDMNNKEIEGIYSSAILDGVSWYISIDYLDRTKMIELHNIKIDEISEILNIINTYKETKGIIRFDILGL